MRELENAIERAAVLAMGTRIDVGDLPGEIGSHVSTAFAPGDTRSLADVEREYILAALAANHGNRAKTATQLAISSATLHRKLAAFGVTTG